MERGCNVSEMFVYVSVCLSVSNPQKVVKSVRNKNDMDKLFDFNVQIQVH